MPANYSSKRIADAERIRRWGATPDSHFASIGLSREAIGRLQAALTGHVVIKGDPGYDTDRQIFNPIFNRYPVAIVYCQTEADAALALAFAKGTEAGFCLRSGGHSTAGYSTCDGIVIDVSALDAVVVDPAAGTVTVGCGCNFGKLYQTLESYGLHVPGGECPDVCIGGFVQGGGYGFTSVTFGLNCDNALSFRVLLASGAIVEASAAANADLFWALRGGTGGNFGVVLSVTYRVRKLGAVTGWALAWPLAAETDIDAATAVMMLLQDEYMRRSICGPEMNMQVSLCYQNHLDPNQPPPPPGTPLAPYLMVRGMWLGDPQRLPALLAGLKAMPGCIDQWTATSSFRDMNEKLLNYPQGMPPLDQMPFEDKSSRYIDRDLTAAQWQTLLKLFAGAPNNKAYGYAEFYGGAINAVGRYDTAFIHRNVALNMVMDVFWLLNADRPACEQFLTAWNDALEPLSNGSAYQNYPSAADPLYVERFWADAYPLLQRIKAKYDPGNVFSFPQEIRGSTDAVVTAEARLPTAVMAALPQPVVPLATIAGG